MANNSLVTVHETSTLTIVDMNFREIDHATYGALQADLDAVVSRSGCDTLGIELRGVQTVCSGFLAHLVALHNRGLRVQLHYVCEHIRDILAVTKLDKLFDVYDMDSCHARAPV